MDAWLVLLIVLIVLAAVAVLLLGMGSRRRRLQQRFGEEYQRVADQEGVQAADRELSQRLKRHKDLSITDLSDRDRGRYLEAWRHIQARFVDEPEQTLGAADRLITDVMADRGYPTESFDQQTADLSVEHAQTVQAYREAHEVAERHARGELSTEELRQAMRRYRELFEDLVGAEATERNEASQ